MRALIIGGGIGGTAAAVALQRAGIEASVFERAATFHEAGAGLSLWPNAIHALGSLGLQRQIAALALPHQAGGIRTWRGDTLLRTSTTAMERRFGAVAVAVLRADLARMLHGALAPQTVQFSRTLVDFAQHASGVSATFDDGSTEHGDMLIGADGVHSRVAALLFGPLALRYAGYTAWRGVARFETTRLQPGWSGEVWGCGARFGIVPMNNDQVYWFATHNAPAKQPASSAGHKQDVAALVRGWCAPVEAVLDATDERAILRNDIYDRAPLKRWSVGRVTLLGDAAHPMTPNLGQGACQALEDAVALAKYLAPGGDVSAAVRAYERARRPRTSMITRQSRQIGAVGQWQNRLACFVRDAAMRALPSGVQMGQMAWILRHRA